MRSVPSFFCRAARRAFIDGETIHDNLDQRNKLGVRVLASASRPGRCGCGREVNEDGFRDLRSLTEYRIGGRCQSCQDAFFLGTSDRDELLGVRFALRQGLLVGHRMELDALEELALLPFIFTAPSREVAWEARFIVRAGAALAPVDVQRSLHPMRPVLEDHLLRVTGEVSLDAPELVALVAGAELVIAAPRVLAYLGAACPRLAAGVGVNAYAVAGVVPPCLDGLEATISGRALDAYWPARPEPRRAPNALRVCAWLGALLASGPLDRVLADRYSKRGVPLGEGEAS